MNNTIKTPEFNGKEWLTKEHSYEELLNVYKKSFDSLPEMVSELKKADNEKWGQLFKDLALHIQNDEKLKGLIRPTMKDGENGISIGEPNWFVVAAAAGFAIGYALGTACYKAGPCKFV